MKRDEKKVDYCLNQISGGKDSFEDLKTGYMNILIRSLTKAPIILLIIW